MDHGHKRATEPDRFYDADQVEEQINKEEAEEREVADEDQDSESSSDEEDGY